MTLTEYIAANSEDFDAQMSREESERWGGVAVVVSRDGCLAAMRVPENPNEDTYPLYLHHLAFALDREVQKQKAAS